MTRKYNLRIFGTTAERVYIDNHDDGATYSIDRVTWAATKRHARKPGGRVLEKASALRDQLVAMAKEAARDSTL